MKRNIILITAIVLTFFNANVNAQDIIMTAGTQSVCAGTFKDPGGDNDYSNNTDVEMTLCSATAGQEISIEFTEFETEANWDDLSIYQGTGTGGTLIGSYDGTSLQGQTITSTGSGCLTFVFDSDGSSTRSGWEADITCVEGCQQFTANTTFNGAAFPTTISLCAGDDFTVAAIGDYPNNNTTYAQSDATSTFTWDFGNGTSNLQNTTSNYGTQGTYTLTLSVEDANGCTYTETYPVTVTCGGACAPCTDIIVDDPDANTCTGTFWDSGMNSNYSSGEDEEITICPDGPGQAVNVNFIEFETESNYDKLWIYNGNSTASPLISGLGGETNEYYDGGELEGNTVTSTSGDGCLTFVWHSDGSGQRPGWIGDIFCSIGCQAIAATTTANGSPITGNISTCISDPISFVPTVTFPNQGLNYTQDIANCTFLWDFGNGTTSTDLNTDITYGTQGTYTVTLTITDGNACPNNFTYTVDVTCGGACAPCTDIFPADPDVNTCVGTFWDSGLNDPYTTEENDTITICSDNGGSIHFHFNEFALEVSTWSDDDYLRVYDGADTDAPSIGMFNNGNPPPTDLIASGTCLTFVFMSDQYSTPGAGWSAEISCSAPCQEFELNVSSDPTADDAGIIHSCPGQSIQFEALPTYPNNDIDYHQDNSSTIITWTTSNGASGNGLNFDLPTDSAFSGFVAVDAVDINGCHTYDTIIFISECQVIDLSFTTDAAIAQNGEIFLLDNSIPLGLEATYGFPENGSCYSQSLGELTWTFGFTDASMELYESHAEDTTVSFPYNGFFDVILRVEDQVGCFNETSVEVHIGCQPVDVSWTGLPANLGDTIIVCPGDSFNLSIYTDYFANNEIYFQEDATSIFNWNMADGTLIPNTPDFGNYAFAESGLYNINLQIIDSSGCTDNTSIPILSFMEPSLEGTYMSRDTICFGDSLILFGNTTVDMPSYSAPPVELPDGSGVWYTSSLTFDMFGDAILTDANNFLSLCMNIEHSYIGDLVVNIECPNGNTVQLFDGNNASSGSQYLGEPIDNDTGNPGIGWEYCFNMGADMNITETGLPGSTSIPAGDYTPEEDWDNLVGCPLNGEWTINILDDAFLDDGFIFAWEIALNQDGLLPPDTIQFPFEVREWSVATGGAANFNTYFEDDAYATPLDTGIYTFTFTTTSPAGCAYDTTIGPLYVAPVPEWTLGNDTNLCASNVYTIPGTLTGGDGTWTYSGPAGATANFSNLNTIPTEVTVSAFGEYIFYFTPNTIAQCAFPDQIAVTFRELPIVHAVIDSTLCFGSCDGEISLTGVGPEAPYNYNYSWSNGDGGSIAKDLCMGNHQVTVSSEYCTNTFDYDVEQPTQLIIYESGKTDNLCYGDTDGEMWIIPSGGTPGYSYTWSNTGNNSITTISNLSGGNYYVTVNDQNGCAVSIDYTIAEPEAPLTIHGIYPSHVACFGENSGSLETNISGGTPNYSYNWLLSDGTNSTVAEPDHLIAGDYFLTVTDLHGCSETSSTVITEPTALVEQNFTSPTSCYDYSDGKAWIIPSGGSAPYAYLWSNGSQDDAIINANAQTYTVTVTDAQNCILVRDLTVEQPLEVILNIAPTPVLCVGESTDLIMSVTSSPFAPYTYFWNGIASTETIEVAPQETTNYTAKVVDSHGCESLTLTKTVEVYQPITTNFSTDKVEVCSGEVVTVNLEPTGGNGSYTYTSLEGEPLSTNFTVQPEESKIYSIIIGDECTLVSDTIEFEITVNEAYSPSFNAITRHGCQPVNVDFIQNTESHAEGTSYLWNFGDESSSSISFDLEPSHNFNTVGNHHITLEITTPKGCKSEKIEYNYISVYPVPVAEFTSSPSAASIINPSIFFENSSVGGEIWQWNFGDGDSTYAWNTAHIFPVIQADYNVELVVSNNFGCTDTASHLIRIVDEVTLYTPTGFTPDGDGKNEIFKPSGNAISENDYSMYIYNRWGEIVFESTDINVGWNGIVKSGSMGQQGIYRFVIKYTDTYGVPHERTGNVNLIR